MENLFIKTKIDKIVIKCNEKKWWLKKKNWKIESKNFKIK